MAPGRADGHDGLSATPRNQKRWALHPVAVFRRSF
jgi:hypothetical protein